jgi:hypothetical protein
VSGTRGCDTAVHTGRVPHAEARTPRPTPTVCQPPRCEGFLRPDPRHCRGGYGPLPLPRLVCPSAMAEGSRNVPIDDPQLGTCAHPKRACRPMPGTSGSIRRGAKGDQSRHHLAISIVPTEVMSLQVSGREERHDVDEARQYA